MTPRVPALVSGLLLALTGLAACNDGGSIPNSYAAMSQGVGFGDYQRHLRAQETARRSNVPYSVPPETRSQPVATGAPMPTIASEALPMTPPAGGPVTVIPANPAPAAAPAMASAAVPAGDTTRPGGVSDSTNFQPLPFGQRPAGAEIPPSGATELVQVASVPTGAASGPNVMAYALQTRHNVGTEMYRRNNPLRWARWERACLQYPSQDLAQEAFLAAGGPERDPNHLDPDGDGFACWWDPQVYRRAASLAAPVAGESLSETD